MATRSHKAGAQTLPVPQQDQRTTTKRSRPSASDLAGQLNHRWPDSKWLIGLAENLLILTFVTLGIMGAMHHELWRDETQSWLLGRDSTSLLDLFHNAKYEGHPLLWHYCLYGLSRISRNMLVMQAFNLLLAVGSVVLIVKKSPFSLLQKGLMVFGYFTLYEYALLSRSYGLGVFLAFLFCAIYCRRRPLFWGLTIVLVLLANTSILGLIMSGVLAIALYYRLTLSPRRKSLGIHLFFLFSAWGLSAIQIGRSLFNPMGLEGFDAEARAATTQAAVQATADATLHASILENLDKLFQIILKSHIPLPTFTFHFWNEHLLQAQIGSPDTQISVHAGTLILSGLLTGLALLVAFQMLKRTPLFLSIYGLGSLSMMGLFVFIYRGSTRHYGHLFILLLVCLWLSQWSRRHITSKSSRSSSFSSYAFTAILCVQAFSGLYAYGSDIFFPFSASYQTAQILQLNQLDDLPLFGINQRPVSPLSGYLDRPIYYPESRQFGSFGISRILS